VAATTTTTAPHVAATATMSTPAAVLSECWSTDREECGQGHCPQRGLVT